MPKGKPDPYLVNVRRGLAGERQSRGAVPANWAKGTTPNHALAILVGNYALDPQGPWRAELLTWLRRMLTEWGLWSARNSDEFGTSSHKAHHYAWQDSLLLFAMRADDAEMLDLVMRVECGVHVVETLCATPSGTLVMAGARCHYGDPKSADQREQGNRRWQWLVGKKVRMPKTLETADDWLGFYCLTLIDQTHKRRAPPEQWAASWPQLRQRITTARDLPLLRNGIEVERTAKGHIVRMLTAEGCLRPALWALADYSTGEETYGCLPEWAQGYRDAKVGDVPLPHNAPQGGKVVTVRGI